MWNRLFRQNTSHHRPGSDQYQGIHRVVHVLRHLPKRCAAFLIPGLFLGKFSNRQIVNKNAPGFIVFFLNIWMPIQYNAMADISDMNWHYMYHHVTTLRILFRHFLSVKALPRFIIDCLLEVFPGAASRGVPWCSVRPAASHPLPHYDLSIGC